MHLKVLISALYAAITLKSASSISIPTSPLVTPPKDTHPRINLEIRAPTCPAGQFLDTTQNKCVVQTTCGASCTVGSWFGKTFQPPRYSVPSSWPSSAQNQGWVQGSDGSWTQEGTTGAPRSSYIGGAGTPPPSPFEQDASWETAPEEAAEFAGSSVL